MAQGLVAGQEQQPADLIPGFDSNVICKYPCAMTTVENQAPFEVGERVRCVETRPNDWALVKGQEYIVSASIGYLISLEGICLAHSGFGPRRRASWLYARLFERVA